MTNIVVVHGALGSAAQMLPIAEALREVGNVSVVELPGHGATSLGDCAFSMQTFVNALADTVQSLSYNASTEGAPATLPVVFSYSMGGYVALTLEAQRPGTFGAIVTLGTKFLWTPDVAAQECARLDARVIEAKVPKFAAMLSERHAQAGGWHNVLTNTTQLLHALGENPPLTRETLGRVAIPVTVAVGDRDETVSVDEAQHVARWMTRGSRAIVTDAPHPIERVASAAIARLVRDAVEVNVHIEAKH